MLKNQIDIFLTSSNLRIFEILITEYWLLFNMNKFSLFYISLNVSILHRYSGTETPDHPGQFIDFYWRWIKI